jgi:predicted Rossmann-fold nucleotide-binding protein
MEELLEAVTLKRLGLYLNPIVLVKHAAVLRIPLIALLSAAISEGFMDERHRAMWQVVDEPEDVAPGPGHGPRWTASAQKFAAL